MKHNFRLILKSKYFLYIVDPPSVSANLASQANIRLRQAYTNKTWAEYRSMLFTFTSFCCYLNIDVGNILVHIAIMLVEFLAHNSLAQLLYEIISQQYQHIVDG